MRGLTALVLAASALAACKGTGAADLDAARKKDRHCVETAATADAAKAPGAWIVVQDGAVAATGKTIDDALAAAARAPRTSAPSAAHRFVYRGADAGDRLFRLTFVPPEGAVLGRRFLADLGWTYVSGGPRGSGRPLVIERRGVRKTWDIAARPAVAVTLTPVGGGPKVAIPVIIDPDYDGPLLVTAAMAAPLALERCEIPGTAEVQVALGRPFDARRAWATVSCPDLDAGGPAEVLVPVARAR